ncbi:MAG: glycosyltransferase [Nitrospirota bacterium]
MNILQVTKGALMGGGERHVLTVLEGFRDRDVNMSLAVFTEGRLSAAARSLGVEVQVIPKRYRGDFSPLLSLMRLIRERQIDIVHTHLLSGNFYGRVAGKISGVKGIVSTLHHTEKGALGRSSIPYLPEIFFKLDIVMTALCNYIISPSLDLKQQVIRQGVQENKIVHIPNAINFEHVHINKEEMYICRRELGLPPDAKLIGMVGRLVPVKNCPLFLRAATRVLNEVANAHFIVVGDGPLRVELEETAEALRLKGHITFTGFREDVMRVVSTFDIFVLCSDSETFPLALIEAMALKKPVVSTDVGGVSEIIDHMRNGWLCPPGDEISLSDAIIHLVRHEEEATEMSARAYEKVVNTFSLRKMTNSLHALYYGLVN